MVTRKTGLRHYTVETNRFQDPRILRLRKGMGCDGYAVYQYIVNEIYRVGGCFLVWDESTALAAAEYWELKDTKVKEIVRYCCAVGLFDKALLSNGSVLTSSSIQSRYVHMCIKTKRKSIIIPPEIDILPEKDRIILEKYRKTPEYSEKTPEKRKEAEEKERTKEKEEQEKKTVVVNRARAREEDFSVLDAEIQALKDSDIWLDSMQTLHHMPAETLRARLDEFRLHCIAHGRDRHDSLTGAKSHFNNWLRAKAKHEKENTHGNNRQPAETAAARRERVLEANRQARMEEITRLAEKRGKHSGSHG